MHALKRYLEKTEKHLWRGLFGEICGITHHSLLKMKSSKGPLLKIWCLQHLKIKKLSRRYKGKSAFPRIVIE